MLEPFFFLRERDKSSRNRIENQIVMQNTRRHSGIGMHFTTSSLGCDAGHTQIWPGVPAWLVGLLHPASPWWCQVLASSPLACSFSFATPGCRPGCSWGIFAVIVLRGYTLLPESHKDGHASHAPPPILQPHKSQGTHVVTGVSRGRGGGHGSGGATAEGKPFTAAAPVTPPTGEAVTL